MHRTRRQVRNLSMGQTVFEETFPIAIVKAMVIDGDSGEGWSYNQTASGSWANAADGPQAIQLGGTIGAKASFQNLSGRTLNGNITVEIIKPNGQHVMKDAPSGALANKAMLRVELTIPADQVGTYQCKYFGELWE